MSTEEAISGPYPRLTRVVLENYRSIAHCDVELKPFTVLVGPNGAGKSNFLDAIVFVADALENGLSLAVNERGGVSSLRHKSGGGEIQIRVEYALRPPVVPNESDANLWTQTNAVYIVKLRDHEGRAVVSSELLEVICDGDKRRFGFELLDGEATWILDDDTCAQQPSFPPGWFDGAHPNPRPTDLYLRAVSGIETFATHHETLRGMIRYHPSVKELRNPVRTEQHTRLVPDASNLAPAFKEVTANQPDRAERIGEYLAAAVPGLKGVSTEPIGESFDLLTFDFEGANGVRQKFDALAVSDGTLRTLALLTACLQPVEINAFPPCWLVAIEEPETAIHPGAAAVLMDAFHEASEDHQILITTHSPDLLEHLEPADQLLVVEWKDGSSLIGPPDYASRESLRKRLYSAGELQRINQLRPDRSSNGSSSRDHSLAAIAQGPT